MNREHSGKDIMYISSLRASSPGRSGGGVGIERRAFNYVSGIDLFGYLNVVPNSNPLGIKGFVSGISISFKCECHIIMQIQYTKNLIPGRFELVTTLS